MSSTLAEKIIERRVDKMRQGKTACDIQNLLSDPEVQVALIPLTEQEYDQILEAVAKMEAPENVAGAAWRDRREQQELLLRCLRDPSDLTIPLFKSVEELNKALAPHDINFLNDSYIELANSFNPTVGAMSDEDIEALKKVLGNLPLNDLSGRQWYALARFLSSLSTEQLMDRLPGSISIN